MPVPAPIQARGSYFHIVLRGYRRNVLFSTPSDRRALNHFAISTMRRFGATLHAYCLLPGQFRFLVQMEDGALVDAVKEIVARYSRYRRRESNVAVELFERPYIAQRVGSNAEFLTLLRSIHLSPVIANATVVPDDYRWSSHRAYMGFKSVAWITTDFGLSLLDADRARARTAYQHFIAEGLAAEVERHKRATKRMEPATADDDGGEKVEIVGVDLRRSRADSPWAAEPHGTSDAPTFGPTHESSDDARRFLSIY
jgi:putative transposase